MIDLKGSLFTDITPENLASQLEVQAFAYALGRQVEKLCVCADRVRIYAAVDDMPERILDVVAVELRTPAYNENFSIEVKRELVKETIPFYTKLGTPAAVNKMIHAVFGGGDMEEWFQYGGDPHHFRAVVNITEMEIKPGAIQEFIRIISSVKRLSSWLDEIRFYLTPAKSWATAGGAFTGSLEKDTATVIPPPLELPGGRFIAIAGGGFMGSWSKSGAVIPAPELTRPGGKVALITGGAFTGSRRKDTATVTPPPLQQAGGRVAVIAGGAFTGALRKDTAAVTPPRLEKAGGRTAGCIYGIFMGTRRKDTATVQPPPLERTGGKAAGRIYGVFMGSRRKDTAAVTHPQLARPEGQAAAAVRAGYIGACQRTTAHIDKRGAGEVPTGKAATGGAAGVFHTYQRITREVKIYGTLERRRSNQ